MVRPDVLCGALTSDKPTVKLLVWPPDKLAETALLSFGMPASLRVIHSGQFDGVGLHEPGFSMSLFGRAIQGRTTLVLAVPGTPSIDRKSTRLNSSHTVISYAVFCLKKKADIGTAPRIVRDYF